MVRCSLFYDWSNLFPHIHIIYLPSPYMFSILRTSWSTLFYLPKSVAVLGIVSNPLICIIEKIEFAESYIIYKDEFSNLFVEFIPV